MTTCVRTLMLSLALMGAGAAQSPAPTKPPEKAPAMLEQIIAKVNGDIITRSEYEQELVTIEARLKAAKVPPDRFQQILNAQKVTALRDLIDQRLLVQRGKELDVNVDGEVTKYMARIQSENKIADPDKFQEWVREATGMSYEDFRSDVRDRMLTQRVIGSEVSSKINIPKADVEKYYNEHKQEFVRQERIFLREIKITNTSKTEEGMAAAEKKAKDLVARARKGERFPELARDNSDSQTAQEGGQIPPMEKGMLREDIEKLVWGQAKNYVTDPIKLDDGYLIVKVDDQHNAGQATLEEVENEIKERLYNPVFEPKIREYLSELRRNAFLEIREGYTDVGAVKGKTTAWNDPALLRPETITKEEVAAQARSRRLLWMFPVPGTKASGEGVSTSK
ncbi:MAG: peptidylprolyl isomerase [Bryobacteraceae bacterium]|nr:peptidylprolyl isomerase [Bryobacteraceae bacterium]